MIKILEKYNKAEISRICGVSYPTVFNWINNNNIPLWAVEKLGFKIQFFESP